MDRRVALAVALTSAGLAVALVAADLQFNVEVTLETMRDGAWVVVASQDADGFASPRYPGSFIGCAGPEMRVVIDNGQPWQTTLDVDVVVYEYATGRTEAIVDESVTIARGAQAVVAFMLPEWATNVTAGPDKPGGAANVEVRIEDTYLSTCVESA